MSATLKLTITWLLLLTSTFLSLFVVDVQRNGHFVSILAYKKFLLIGFVYLEGMKAHWFYKIMLIALGASLLLADYVWKLPRVCN